MSDPATAIGRVRQSDREKHSPLSEGGKYAVSTCAIRTEVADVGDHSKRRAE